MGNTSEEIAPVTRAAAGIWCATALRLVPETAKLVVSGIKQI